MAAVCAPALAGVNDTGIATESPGATIIGKEALVEYADADVPVNDALASVPGTCPLFFTVNIAVPVVLICCDANSSALVLIHAAGPAPAPLIATEACPVAVEKHRRDILRSRGGRTKTSSEIERFPAAIGVPCSMSWFNNVYDDASAPSRLESVTVVDAVPVLSSAMASVSHAFRATLPNVNAPA